MRRNDHVSTPVWLSGKVRAVRYPKPAVQLAGGIRDSSKHTVITVLTQGRISRHDGSRVGGAAGNCRIIEGFYLGQQLGLCNLQTFRGAYRRI